MHVKSLQSCLTLCDPMDCSPPSSSVYGIVQARILGWVAMPSSRGSFPPRMEPVFLVSCIGRQVLYHQRHQQLINNIVIVPDALQRESVQFSCPDGAMSLRPHGLQHARHPSPSPTPGACSGTQPHIYIYPFSPILPSHPLSRVSSAILQVARVYQYITYWYM